MDEEEKEGRFAGDNGCNGVLDAGPPGGIEGDSEGVSGGGEGVSAGGESSALAGIGQSNKASTDKMHEKGR